MAGNYFLTLAAVGAGPVAVETRGLPRLTLHGKWMGGSCTLFTGRFCLFKKTKQNLLNGYILLSTRYFASFTLVLTAPYKGDILSPTRAPPLQGACLDRMTWCTGGPSRFEPTSPLVCSLIFPAVLPPSLLPALGFPIYLFPPV